MDTRLPDSSIRQACAPRVERTNTKRTGPLGQSEAKPLVGVLLVCNSCTYMDGLELAIAQTRTLHVTCRAGSAAELFACGAALTSDVALVDIDLPDQSGFEVCQRLLESDPKIHVVLTGYSDWDIYLLAAQTVHSSGLVLYNQPPEEIIAALEKAAVQPIFSVEQMQRVQTWRNTTGAQLRSLRPREWQVLQLVALGQTNREIAQQLSISENTIEKHVSNLLQKLELASRAMMMVFIFTHHLDALSRLPHGDRFLMLLAN